MMIIVQKVTTLAFSLHDGRVKLQSGERLTDTQTREAIVYVTFIYYKYDFSEIPTILEFFSYTMNYMGMMCGPLCFFADYIAFIDGMDRPTGVAHLVRSDKQQAEKHLIQQQTSVKPLPEVPDVN